MNEIQNDILEKMRLREKEPIKNGNTIIQSKVGILNFPRGFGRKLIVCSLIKESLYDWEKETPFQYEILDKLYHQGQIIKKNIIESKKTNYSIILCHSSEINLWKEVFFHNNISFSTFLKKNNTFPENNIILTTPPFFIHLLQNNFHRKAIQRIFICNPEQLKMKQPLHNMIFYGMTWILLEDPNWILSHSDKKHFIYHFIPEKIDILLFRYMTIHNNPSLKHDLFQKFNLPRFEILHHKCRQEMFVILKDHLQDEMYSLLERGQIKIVLEKMNEMGTCSNLYDYIQEKINIEIEEANLNLQSIHDENLIQKWKEKKKLLENKKLFLKDKIDNYHEENDCTICSETFKEPILLYCCHNIICGKCIFTWLQTNNKCPYCRHIIHNDDLVSLKYKISSKNRKRSNSVKLLSKQNKIIEIILKNKESYIFFYTESNDILQNMIEFSKENKISFIHFQGSKKEKDEYFRNILSYHIICLTDKNDFIGYSFEHIDHFISHSKLEKKLEEYFFSRFYRIGRKNPFFFHTFMN